MRGWVRLALAAAGLLLIAVYLAWTWSQPRGLFEFAYGPFTPEPLPWAPMRGFTYEQLAQHIARAALLGPAMVGLWLLFVFSNRANFSHRLPVLSPTRWAAVVAAASVAFTAVLTFGVLRGRALIDDEFAYSMQAGFLSELKLGRQGLDFTPGDVFTIGTRIGYTGKYLIGEPLVQIPGVLVGIPALLHPLLLGLTLWAWFVAVKTTVGERVAALATGALALSPMVVVTTATGLSHATALLCIVVAGLGLAWIRARRELLGAAFLAFGLGYAFLTRPQVGVPVGAVWVPWAFYLLIRRRQWRPLLLLSGIGAAFIAVVGAYDTALSGDPLKLPWFLQCVGEKYGFGRVWVGDTYEHTPMRALENLLVVLIRFNGWWLGLPWGLALVVVWFVLGRPRKGFATWFAAAGALTIFEAGYYSTGVSDTGPIYHYEWILPGSLLAGTVLDMSLRRWPSQTRWAAAISLVLGTGSFYVEQVGRIHRLVTAIHADADRVMASIPGRALLLHETSETQVRSLGWVHDSFPERHRRRADRIITFPRPYPSKLKEVLDAFPGRDCWYVHRDPNTAKMEWFPCASATSWLNQNDQVGPVRSLVVHSTAFEKTDFDPFAAIRHRAVLSNGVPLFPCCVRDQALRAGAVVPPWRCLPE